MKKIKRILLLSVLPTLFFMGIFIAVLLAPLMIFSGDAITAEYGNDIFYGAELNGYTFTFSQDAIFHFPFIPQGEIRISSGFGYRYLNGKREYHNALDFPMAQGTPILAAEEGVVTHAGRNGGYGILVIVEHNEKYSTRYAHLNSVAVAKGDQVKRGQVIAFSGNTGRSTGAHLHFEVRENHVAVNPVSFISLRPDIPTISQEDIAYKDISLEEVKNNLSMSSKQFAKLLLEECKKNNLNPLLITAIINHLPSVSREDEVIALVDQVKELINKKPSVINPLLWLNQLQDQEYWWMAVAKEYQELIG